MDHWPQQAPLDAADQGSGCKVEPAAPPRAAGVLAAAAGVLALVCLPLLFAVQLPLVDMPAHSARLEIIDQLLKNGPLADFYAFEPGLVPNLLFDGIGWALLKVLPVDVVGSIYLVLTLAAQLFGTVALHRSLHGRYSYWPLVAALLLYNLDFFYGYLSYLTGVGLALLALALWIALCERAALLRLAAGSVAAMLLFLSHIVPLIVYAAAVAGWELQAAARARHRPREALGRLCVGAAQFVVPAILFLGETPTAGLANETAMFRLDMKIGSLVATPTSGAAATDAVALAVVIAGALLLPLACRVRFARTFATALACVLVAFALMPWGLGPVVNLDTRMPLAIFFIAIAAVDVTVRRGRLAAVLTCGAVMLLLMRTASVGAQAAAFSDRFDAYRDAFRRLPEGAIVFTGVNEYCPPPPPPGGICHEIGRPPPASLFEVPWRLLFPEIYVTRLDTPRHIAALASIDRNVFVPQIFATRGLQPISVRPPLAALKRLQADDPIVIRTDLQMAEATARLLAAADTALPGRPVFLLLQWLEGAADLAPEDAAVVVRGPQFTLYRIAPSSR